MYESEASNEIKKICGICYELYFGMCYMVLITMAVTKKNVIL